MKNRKVVAIIPARKNSRRLLHKNRLLLNGKELFKYTIEQAIRCEFIDEIILTTDDEVIIDLAQIYAYEPRFRIVERPSEISQDDSPVYKYVLHALKDYENDTIIILLQPTSPLRLMEDIEGCYATFLHNKLPLVSVCKLNPKLLLFNGAVYVLSLDVLKQHKSFTTNPMIHYEIPLDRSIDIDNYMEFKMCEVKLKNDT